MAVTLPIAVRNSRRFMRFPRVEDYAGMLKYSTCGSENWPARRGRMSRFAAQTAPKANSAEVVFVTSRTLRQEHCRNPARLHAVRLWADRPAHTARWTGIDLWCVRIRRLRRVGAGVGL
jgi:hypothetical protein